MDEPALELLRDRGWAPGEQLGAGSEGTVISLDDATVAKIWHGRSAADLDQLHSFTAALDDAHLAFGTPSILEVIEDQDHLITIERRLHGRPVRTSGPEQDIVMPAETQLLGDVLEAFATATAPAGLAALPILAGEESFDPRQPFHNSLAAFVEHRFSRSRHLLRPAVTDVDDIVSMLVSRLRDLPTTPSPRLIHGDLIPANVLTDGGRLTAVLDFGFLTTLGDPAFDAAITASIFDMYGPHARTSEDILTQAFLTRFDHDADIYNLYRGAYAVATSTYFSPDGSDGHFAWCARMLDRPDVRSATR